MIVITTLDRTGEPIAVLQLPDQAHADANTVGTAFVEGECPLNSYYANGAWVVKPLQLDFHHQWDAATKSWVDPRPLPAIQAAQWIAIKASRDAAIAAPLVTPYGTFDADPASQTAITNAVLMLQSLAALGTPTTIDFTLHDNTTVTLTGAEMTQVGLLLGAQTQAAYTKARAYQTAINSATTPAEVQAITWS